MSSLYSSFSSLFNSLLEYVSGPGSQGDSDGGLFEWRKGALFLISILCLYTLFWFFIQFVGLGFLRSFTAWAASGLLEIAGISNSVEYIQDSIPVIVLTSAEHTGILESIGGAVTDLCVGDIELALLPAIILSTFDRSIRKRLIGVVSGIILIVIVNPLRIFFVMWTGANFGWGFAELMHSFTFRLTLILIILGFYYIWYLKYDAVSSLFTKVKVLVSKRNINREI